MTIEKTNQDGSLTLALTGRLDSLSADDLETALQEEISEELKTLTIDLKEVDFVSSKGLRVLVGAYKRMNGREMILDHVNSSVMEVLRLSGLLKIFTVRE